MATASGVGSQSTSKLGESAARHKVKLSLPGKICVGVAAAAVFVALVVVLALYLAGVVGVPQQQTLPLQAAQVQYDPCSTVNSSLGQSSKNVPSFTLESITTGDGVAEGPTQMLGTYIAVKPMAWLSGLSGLWTNGPYFITYGTWDGGATFKMQVEAFGCTKSEQTEEGFYETTPVAFNANAPLGDVGVWQHGVLGTTSQFTFV
jgi:hypothetical protein